MRNPARCIARLTAASCSPASRPAKSKLPRWYGFGEVGREADQRSGEDIGDQQIIGSAQLQQRIVHPVRHDHHRLASAAAHRDGVEPRVFLDHAHAHRVDIGEGAQRARPQRQRGKAQQPGAGADIGDIAGDHAARLHVAQHLEAPGGGLCWPVPKAGWRGSRSRSVRDRRGNRGCGHGTVRRGSAGRCAGSASPSPRAAILRR